MHIDIVLRGEYNRGKMLKKEVTFVKQYSTTEALKAYFEVAPISCEPYGNGHINDTYLVLADQRYILQKMNTIRFLIVVYYPRNIPIYWWQAVVFLRLMKHNLPSVSCPFVHVWGKRLVWL